MAKKFKMDDDPFEGVLPHLKDSRKKKDDDVNNDNVSDSVSAKNNDSATAKNINNANDNDRNNSRNITRNNVSNNDTNNIKDNVSVNDSNNSTNNVSDVIVANVNDTDVDNINDVSAAVSNFINIAKKQKKTDGYIRISTYLLPDQVKAIEDLQKMTGRDKGELYRMAVNILIERARVE